MEPRPKTVEVTGPNSDDRSGRAIPRARGPRRRRIYFFAFVVDFLAVDFLADFFDAAFFVAMALLPPFLVEEFTARENFRQWFFLAVFTFFTITP